MSYIWFTSDLHLGHRGILKYRKVLDVQTVQEHDEMVIDNIVRTVKKRDILYILGDICFDHKSLPLLDRVPCRIKGMLGNHDKLRLSEYMKYMEVIPGIVKKYNYWLSHAPIHPQELFGKGNLHGHTHGNHIPDGRYLDVGIDSQNGFPIHLDVINKRFQNES